MAHDDDLTESEVLDLIELGCALEGAPGLALFPASFGAPCTNCGRPRLSATETLCVDCSVEVSP